MGNVRPEAVKKIAKDIHQKYPEKVSLDFEANKKVVEELVTGKSKKLRNRIAGYVTRLKAIEVARASAPEFSSEEMASEAG